MGYVCGQCASSGLYRDDDHINGVVYIACRICGNRWPGGMKPVSRHPVEAEDEKRSESGAIAAGIPGDDADKVEGTSLLEGESGATTPKITQGAARILEKSTTKVEGKKMAKKGRCSNCGRDMSLVSNNRCFVCYSAARAKTGDQLLDALREVRRKIQCGEIRTRGISGPRKAETTDVISCVTDTVKISELSPRPFGPERGGTSDQSQRFEAILDETAEPQTVIPIKLALTVEINVKVTGIVA